MLGASNGCQWAAMAMCRRLDRPVQLRDRDLRYIVTYYPASHDKRAPVVFVVPARLRSVSTRVAVRYGENLADRWEPNARRG